jgi:hypothetical protein
MKRLLAGTTLLLAMAIGLTSADGPIPPKEKLTYTIEWKFIHAGNAIVETQPGAARLTLESAGLVSAMLKIREVYDVKYDDPFCATSSTLDALEGKRHHDTKITFDRRQGKAFFVERDLVKNTTVRNTNIATPRCVQDVLGSLLRLRATKLDPVQSTQFPVSDGRKSASVKVESQARETIKTAAGSFACIKYEANLMNGVVYTRPGRVFVWLSDDARRLLVRVELRLGIVGAVTLDLEKAERL